MTHSAFGSERTIPARGSAGSFHFRRGGCREPGFAEFVPECPETDAKSLRGMRAVVVASGQDGKNVAHFRFVRCFRIALRGTGRHGNEFSDPDMEVRRFEDGVRATEHRTLDGILELADIAGPLMVLKCAPTSR